MAEEWEGDLPLDSDFATPRLQVVKPWKLQRRAIGYVRVSVDNERKVSPEIQAEAITKLCAAKGWELVHTEVERGRSAGTGKKRPGLDHVRDMIRCGDADTLVVWKLDRCSRSVHDFSVLLEELRERAPGSCRAPRASTRPTRWVRRWCRSRWCSPSSNGPGHHSAAVAWHAHRARRGDPYLGRVPFGYVRARDDDGRPVGPLEIDAETAPLVQQAAAVFLETRSMMAVQRFFDEHGHQRAGWRSARARLSAAGRHPHRRRREDPRQLAGHLGRVHA